MNNKQKATKEFLSNANFINQSIQSKLEQVQSLNDMATNATTTFSDLPGSPNRNKSKLEDIIIKIVDLQEEINLEIDYLIDYKKRIKDCINQIPDQKGRLILEEKYIRNSTWEEISETLGCSIRHLHRIHDEMLNILII